MEEGKVKWTQTKGNRKEGREGATDGTPEGLKLGRVRGVGRGLKIGTEGERETSVEEGWGRENQGKGGEGL